MRDPNISAPRAHPAHPDDKRRAWLTFSNSVDLVRLGIGNLDAKLLLDGHDDLDGVERVESEVRGESGIGGELLESVLMQYALRRRSDPGSNPRYRLASATLDSNAD